MSERACNLGKHATLSITQYRLCACTSRVAAPAAQSVCDRRCHAPHFLATDGRLEQRDGNMLKELLAQRGARADATGQGLQPRCRRRTLGLTRGHGLARGNSREPLLLALLRPRRRRALRLLPRAASETDAADASFFSCAAAALTRCSAALAVAWRAVGGRIIGRGGRSCGYCCCWSTWWL